MKFFFSFLQLAIIVNGLGFSVNAAQFEVQGIFRIVPLGTMAPQMPSTNVLMKISVSECNWIVRMQWPHMIPDYTEVGTDGTNIFKIDRSEHYASTLDFGKRPEITSVGLVQSGIFPQHPIRPEIGVLFLAYASRCFLERNTNSLLPPILPAFGSAVRPASWRYGKDNGLPEELVYYGNTRGRYSSLPKGFTNEILRASDFVDVNGIDIPKQITYRVNSVRELDTEGEYEIGPLMEYSFVATNVSGGSTAITTVPALPPKSVLVDKRFSPMPEITVVRSTNTWPTDAEIQSTPQYKNLLPVDWERNPLVFGDDRFHFGTGGRILLVSTLLGLLVCPLLILRKRHNNKK